MSSLVESGRLLSLSALGGAGEDWPAAAGTTLCAWIPTEKKRHTGARTRIMAGNSTKDLCGQEYSGHAARLSFFRVTTRRFRPRQIQIALQQIEHIAGKLACPLVQLSLAPVAVQANGFSEVFRERLPVSAFTDERLAQL